MTTIPKSERNRFETLLNAQAKRYGLRPDEYLRKVWYHEEAAKLGEYMAMVLLDELLPLATPIETGREKQNE